MDGIVIQFLLEAMRLSWLDYHAKVSRKTKLVKLASAKEVEPGNAIPDSDQNQSHHFVTTWILKETGTAQNRNNKV
jgi:hypothetical protein